MLFIHVHFLHDLSFFDFLLLTLIERLISTA